MTCALDKLIMNSHKEPREFCVLHIKCFLNWIYLEQSTYDSMELYFEEKLLTSLSPRKKKHPQDIQLLICINMHFPKIPYGHKSPTDLLYEVMDQILWILWHKPRFKYLIFDSWGQMFRWSQTMTLLLLWKFTSSENPSLLLVTLGKTSSPSDIYNNLKKNY